MTGAAAIQSEGDLEVVLLHESHNFLADLIGPELYSVGGTAPEQSILFHTQSSFNLFLILLVEFFTEGARSSFIHQKFQNWSLIKGLRWFCDRHGEESQETGLEKAVQNLETWKGKEVALEFWCPDVNTTVTFPLKNEQLVSFGANTAKHHLFRLADLLTKLEKLCNEAGYKFIPQQYPAVLASMIEEVRGRLQYHSSYIVELLGQVFLAINNVVVSRFNRNPTNCVTDMKFPDGITSDVFRDLYGSVMVFMRYDEARIVGHTPVTTRYLKMR